jgi:hypothetical protein
MSVLPAHVDLARVLCRLRAAVEDMDAVMDAHGPRCRCTDCRREPEQTGEILDDLRGLRWCLQNGLSLLECELPPHADTPLLAGAR